MINLKNPIIKRQIKGFMKLSKRFFGVPSFFNYAMTDGIFALLKYSKQVIIEFKSRIGPHHDAFQLLLFPD